MSSVIRILKKFPIVLLYLIFYYLFVFMFIPYLNFQPWFRWYRAHDGDSYPDGRKFLQLMAYYHYMYVYYILYKLFLPVDYVPDNNAEMEFMSGLLFGNAADFIKIGQGVITPAAMFSSIVPVVVPSSGAWPNNKADWRAFMIKEWGCSDTADPASYARNSNVTMWKNAASNFLWINYGIPYNSPMMVAFITGASSDANGNILYPSALEPLIGLTLSNYPGGWWGFLKQGKFGSIDIIKQILWSTDNPTINITDTNPNVNGTQCSASGWISSALGGIGIGAIPLFLASATNPVGWVVGIALAAGATFGTMGAKGCL